MEISNFGAMEGLIIGYDAKRAALNTTGLGNYSRLVIDVMSAAYPGCQFRLYSPAAEVNSRLNPLIERGNVSLVTPAGPLKAVRPLWRSFGVASQAAADGVMLYHGLSNELPLNIRSSQLASVLTMHDVIYRRFPSDYRAADRALYDFKYGRSCRNATRIIAISECTRRDLTDIYGIDPQRIDVVYQGIDPVFAAAVGREQREKARTDYGLPERFILSVGTVSARKNQLLAVKALRGLPSDVKLAIVGRRTSAYAAEIDAYISSHGLADRVVWLTDVPFSRLPELYAAARLSSYTSRYEGFGLPVVESLSCGTPVIAATGSCLEEAGGKGALYVGPDDVDAYVDAARRLLDDNYLHGKLADAGRRHVRRFSLAEMARLTMATYRKALIDTVFS